MNRLPRVTLQDVADAAGVARGTASSALSGKGRMSAETRQRIKTAALNLGYTANPIARSLRTDRTGTIGLVLPPIDLHRWYLDFAGGTLDAALPTGFNTLLLNERLTPADLPSLPVDGFVFAEVIPAPLFAAAVDDHRPVAVGDSPGTTSDLVEVSVQLDDATGTELLLSELGGPDEPAPILAVSREITGQTWADTVIATYTKWCTRHGKEARVEWVEPENTERIRDVIEKDGTSNPPVLCVSLGLAAAFNGQLSLAHPGQRPRVASFPDSPDLAASGITALDLQPRELGYRCVTQLLDILVADNGAEVRKPRSSTLTPVLLRRGSTTQQ